MLSGSMFTNIHGFDCLHTGIHLLTRDHVELFIEPIFLEDLRRLVDSPMGVFGDGTKSIQHS